MLNIRDNDLEDCVMTKREERLIMEYTEITEDEVILGFAALEKSME